jgi:hypothetical protein
MRVSLFGIRKGEVENGAPEKEKRKKYECQKN